MTRKLPWKRIGNNTSSSPKPTKSTPIREPKPKVDSDNNDELPPTPSISTKPVKTSNSRSATPKRIPRNGSTSPPPEPLPESYMIEGLDHDDLFRMVEDEFLSVAQQYTAHLHAAEYHRLKAASKSQNADTIRDISRPVVGRMTDLVKIKQDRKARLRKQKLAAQKAAANKGRSPDHTDTESDDEWRGTTLHGLLESPKKQEARIDNLTKVMTSTTRAAAGFNGAKSRLPPSAVSYRSSEKPSSSKSITQPTIKDAGETEEDEDDLDRPPSKVHAKSQTTSIKPTHNTASNKNPTRQPVNESHSTKPQSQLGHTNKATSNDSGGDFLSNLKKRQEERKRAREQRKIAASKAQSIEMDDDIIPGFL